MKTIGMLSVAMMVMSGWIASYGQVTESEVPGDNFSLEGALELFKKSESPEEFEKLLNSADSKVNNLDLNGDGYIDYIRVIDRQEGNVHAFILQAVVSEKENQDIAVIELEKLANGKAVLQIVGDEDIYGIETIIEPTREVRTYAGTTSSQTVVNVWAWPAVRYIYGPYYSVWVSPWSWYYRPFWWHVWRPIAYVHYYPIWRPYYNYYSYCHSHRIVYAHQIYRPYRTTSVIVYNRHHARVDRYRDDYRNGRTRNDDRYNGRYSQNSRTDRSSTSGLRTDYSQNNRDRSASRYTTGQRREVDLNRRSSTQREVTTQNRSTTIERSGTDVQRNSREVRSREDFQNSRSRTFENTGRETRNPNLQQRSTVRERSVPNEVQRNSGELKRRDDFSNRSSGTFQNNRETRQQATRSSSFERTRSSGNPNVQQRSIYREQGSQGSSGIRRDNSSNRSSGTIHQGGGGSRQQINRSSSGGNRSSGSHNVQRSVNRSSGSGSSGIKRGRD